MRTRWLLRSDRDILFVLPLIVLMGLFARTSAGQSKIIWVDSGNSSVHAAHLDGTNSQILIESKVSLPQGFAVNDTRNEIFWVEKVTGEIRRANLDGSNVSVIVSGIGSPSEIDIDPPAGKIYWTDYKTGNIRRANLDGTSVENLVTEGLESPDDLVLDLAAGKIYWTDAGTRKVQRASLDGTGVEDIVTGLEGNANVSHHGIALDLPNGHIYWTDGGYRILRANLDGSSIEVFSTEFDSASRIRIDSGTGRMFVLRARAVQGEVMGVNLDLSDFQVLAVAKVPFGLELDPVNGLLYWSDPGTGTLHRAELDGTSPEPILSAVAMAPRGLAVSQHGGTMYWTTKTADIIQRANVDGSTLGPFYSEFQLTTEDVAIDDTSGKVYWSDQWFGNIKRANLDGSNVEIVRDFDANGGGRPSGLAVDEDGRKLYWTIKGGILGIGVGRTNLDGSDPEMLVVTGSIPDDLALDINDGKMYWSDAGDEVIRRANLDGTGLETLVSGLVGLDQPFVEHFGIALDISSGKMYWSEPGTGSIRRANLDGSNTEDVFTGLPSPNGVAILLDERSPYVEELLKLFYSTDGLNWTDNTNWGSSEPLGDWYGITVEDGKITRLELPDNGLSGEIKIDLGLLVDLEILNLQGNALIGSIPDILAEGSTPTRAAGWGDHTLGPATRNEPVSKGSGILSSLVELRLNDNDLSGPIPESLGELSALVVLDLSGNALTGPVPDQLGVLLNLAELNLSDNQLVGTLPQSLTALSNLESFHFDGTDLCESLDPEFQTWLAGLSTISSTGCTNVHVQETDDRPLNFELSQNYPNPFNPSTELSYSVARTSEVNLSVFDTSGRLVRTLVNRSLPAGTYSATLDAQGLSSGLYLIRMETPTIILTRKVVLLK